VTPNEEATIHEDETRTSGRIHTSEAGGPGRALTRAEPAEAVLIFNSWCHATSLQCVSNDGVERSAAALTLTEAALSKCSTSLYPSEAAWPRLRSNALLEHTPNEAASQARPARTLNEGAAAIC